MLKLDSQISMRTIIAIIYDTYHIVSHRQAIPYSLLTIDGIETLVKESKIPREVATLLYKLMLEIENAETNND